MSERKTVNVSGALSILGCSRSYLYVLLNDGKIEGRKFGEKKGTRFYLDSLHAHLKKMNPE